MGWPVLGSRPAGAWRAEWLKRGMGAGLEVGMSFARQRQRSDRNAGARMNEGAHRGRSPQGVGRRRGGRRSRRVRRARYLPAEPRRLESPRRALERWAKRYPERRWAVENAGGLGRHLSGRLAATGESVVDVPPKLSARVRVLSTGNARKNDGLDALATALAASRNERLTAVDPEVGSEALRLLSERREDLVAERTRGLNRLHGLLRDLVPGGVAGTLSAHRAARILRGIRPQEGASTPRPASAGGWLRRSCATSVRWIERSRT